MPPKRSTGKNSSASPHNDDDDRPLLPTETEHPRARNSRQRPLDQDPNRNEDEHHCCCCS